MLVRDIMSSPAVTVSPDTELRGAARVLDRLSLTSLPVVASGGRLLGLISEADVIGQLASREDPTPGTHRRDEVTLVRDLMTLSVLTVEADDDVAAIVALMTGTTLKSLPVLLRGRLAGMVSRRDVVRALAHGDFDAPDTGTLAPPA